MPEPVASDIDPEFLTDEIRSIIKLKKRTDDQASLLADAKRKSLSAGAKSHVRSLAREAIYGYEPADLNTRPILKGRLVEHSCIDLLSRLTGRPLTKNTERRTNGIITGECDVFDHELSMGRDIKAPYSVATMPISIEDCFDSIYFYQMQGYMILWDADTWSVDYVLVDTPPECLGNEPIHLHAVTHIPEHLRVTSWVVQKDKAIESLIIDKVSAARRYYKRVINDFDRTHIL
jgi:hypothetical protein